MCVLGQFGQLLGVLVRSDQRIDRMKIPRHKKRCRLYRDCHPSDRQYLMDREDITIH